MFRKLNVPLGLPRRRVDGDPARRLLLRWRSAADIAQRIEN